jgi:hypothetical protein
VSRRLTGVSTPFGPVIRVAGGCSAVQRRWRFLAAGLATGNGDLTSARGPNGASRITHCKERRPTVRFCNETPVQRINSNLSNRPWGPFREPACRRIVGAEAHRIGLWDLWLLPIS